MTDAMAVAAEAMPDPPPACLTATVAYAALAALPQAIFIFDPAQCLCYANPAAYAALGLAPAALPPGTPLAEAVRIGAFRGLYGPGDPEPLAEETLAIDRSRPFRRVLRGAGEAGFLWTSAPLPGGGFIASLQDITAEQAAAEETARSAARLADVLDHLQEGVALYDADGRLAFRNPAYETLNGVPRGGIPHGLHRRDVLALLARRGEFANLETPPGAAEADHLLRDRPTTLQRQRASGRVLHFASQPMPFGGHLLEVTDITAVKRAEDEARQRAALVRLMLDGTRHGIALFGPDLRLIIANRLASGLAGVAPADMRPGVTAAQVAAAQRRHGIYGEGRAAAAEEAEVAARDRRRAWNVRRRMPDGRIIDSASDPTPDGGFVITWSDVTALVAAEAAASTRAALLGAALDNIRHGILLFGPDQRLLAANALAGEIAGLTAEVLAPGTPLEVLLRHTLDTGQFGTGEAAEREHARILALDRTRPQRYVREVVDGRVVDITSTPTPDGGFVITHFDITESARARAEQQRRAQLLQATLDNVRHGIAMYGPDRRLLFANRLAGALQGLPGLEHRAGALFDDLVQERWRLGHFGTGPDAERHFQETLRLDRSRSCRDERRLADGRVLDIASSPTPDGGFVVTHSDISELVAARAEVSARAATLQVMLDNLRHGIAYFGPDRALRASNHLAEAMAGHPPGSLAVGRTFEEVAVTQAEGGGLGDPAAAAEVVRKAVALDRSRPARYSRRSATGRVLDIISTPTPDGGFVVTHTDVTELLAAQAAAAERASQLQLMLDSMRHGIALYDKDRRMVAANGLAAELNGLPRSAIRPGRTAREFGEEAVARGQRSRADLEASLAADVSRPVRRTRTLPDGRVIEVCADPTPDGGLVATYTDITALTRAEAAARERANTLQVMLENTRHGICYFGADRRVIAANRLAAEFGNHPPGAMLPGRPLEELLDDLVDAGPQLAPTLAEIAAQGKAMDRSRPARYVRPGRGGRVIEVTSDPTPEGGFVVTTSDITALAGAEAEAKRRAALQQVMLDNIRHGIVLFDQAGQVLAVNAMLRSLLDLPDGVLAVGEDYDRLVDHLAARGEYGPGAEGLAVAASIKSRDRSRPARSTRTRPNGRSIEIVSDPTPGGGWVLTYSDVTEDRQIRAELEQARERAETASRAKSRFLATMSHELRTPLNAVIGFAEAYQVDRDPERRDEYVRSIQEAGRHLLSLIDDILDVTRSETTGFAVTEAEVDIAAAAEASVRVMQATAATAGVSVRSDLPAGLPLVRADEVRLRQVLLNLLSNAVKFTAAGGQVVLRAALEPAGDLLVSVADTGIGISQEDMGRIFQPFTQLDSSLSRRFPGSGLGLYLSRALAEAQGATLTLESAPGIGTTALLRFPATRLLPLTQPG